MNIRTTSLYADFADDSEAGITHSLIFFVRQRLGGSDSDRIPGVDAHRVKVFDGTDDHDVVVDIPHHLHLILFPTDNRLFDQHFSHGRLLQSLTHKLVEFFPVVGDRGSRSTHRKRRSDNGGQADHLQSLASFLDGMNRFANATIEPDLLHRLFELVTFFGFGDHGRIGTNHLATKLFENAVSLKIHRDI